MKSVFSGLSSFGLIVVVVLLFAFGSLTEFLERHLVSIICVIAAIGAFILYIRSDDDSNTPFPPEKFEG